MGKSLIIFDMDGTLIDSSRTIANSINYVRKNINLEPMDHKQIISKINDQSISSSEYFYETDGFTDEQEQWFNEYYTQNHAKELALYDGIYELLEWLHKSGIKIALATNAYRISALESIAHFGISKFFGAVACADDVPKAKPAPDMLYKILLELDKSNEDALFVGDGPRDEDAADNAAMDYLMVDWGFTDYGKSDLVIDSVGELKSKLEKLISS